MAQNKYECEQCGAVFYTQEDREKHNRTVHSRFRCDICGEIFDSEAELEAHNPIAHPEIRTTNTG